MKTILIISIIGLLFYSCSKSNNPAPTTWISGKWKMTAAYDDTLGVNVDNAAYLDELNFINSNTVTSHGAATNFTYSLTTMTINEGGVIYKIIQTSNTTFKLTSETAHIKMELFVKE